MLFITLISHFCLMQLQGDKNTSLIYVTSKQRIFFVLIPQVFCQQIHKKFTTAGKRLTTAKYVFFIGAAIKIAVGFSAFQFFYADDLLRQICSQ